MIGHGKYYGNLSLAYTIIPQSPTNLHVSELTDHSVNLNWTKAPGAGYYEVHVIEGGKTVRVDRATATSYTVDNLKSGTSYTFEVKAAAKGSDGGVYYGKTSLSATATTLAGAATGVYSITASDSQVTVQFNGVPEKTDGSWNLIVAAYNGSGKMTAVAMMPVTKQSMTLSLRNASTADHISAYVVDGSGKPLMKEYTEFLKK